MPKLSFKVIRDILLTAQDIHYDYNYKEEKWDFDNDRIKKFYYRDLYKNPRLSMYHQEITDYHLNFLKADHLNKGRDFDWQLTIIGHRLTRLLETLDLDNLSNHQEEQIWKLLDIRQYSCDCDCCT